MLPAAVLASPRLEDDVKEQPKPRAKQIRSVNEHMNAQALPDPDARFKTQV